MLVPIGVGVLVTLAARAIAGSSCPPHETLTAASTCQGLVGSLAVRVGITAGVVALLAQVVAAGLARTAEALDRDRATHAREAGR